MRSKSLRALLPALIALLFATAVGCGADDEGGGGSPEPGGASATGQDCQPKVDLPTRTEGVLEVVGPTYPPLFEYNGGEASGVDGELLTQIAKDACLELNVRIQPAAGVIESVQSGRADVAAGGWYISPERAKIVGQTNPVYADPPMLVTKTGESNIENLRGQTIGTTQGYLWEDDLKEFAGDDAKFYQSPDAVYADLKAGRIDAGLMAVNEASHRLKNDQNTELQAAILDPTPVIAASQRPSVTNFPHTKGKQQLTAGLNEAIENLRQSGAIAQALEKYGLDPELANPETAGAQQ